MDGSVSSEKPLPPTSPARNSSHSTEWLALVECASARQHGRFSTKSSGNSVKWPDFLQLATDHGLIPLVTRRLKPMDPELIPPGVAVKFRQLQRSSTLLTLQLTAELFRVLDRFSQAVIPVLLTKGPALSVRCYGDPGQRQYGDLDLIIRQADIRRATQAMPDLGYEPRVPLTAIDANKSAGEYAFRKSGTGLLVEFHTERTFRYHPRPLPIEKLFERSTSLTIDNRSVPALSLEDELVLICVHGAKHFWERLMWIADVAALISRQSLDWDRANAVAREVGAQRILRLGLRLASDLLGAELPPALDLSVRSDRAVASLAAQIETRLASRRPRGIGLWQRAVFRVRMPGGFLDGFAYLLRLSLSPTEDDWNPDAAGNRSALVETIGRPFRLAKKHRRHPE